MCHQVSFYKLFSKRSNPSEVFDNNNLMSVGLPAEVYLSSGSALRCASLEEFETLRAPAATTRTRILQGRGTKGAGMSGALEGPCPASSKGVARRALACEVLWRDQVLRPPRAWDEGRRHVRCSGGTKSCVLQGPGTKGAGM